MTRILLADDHLVVRQGLKQILEGSLAGAVFADAASGEEAIRHVRAADWDLLILDMSLPDQSGLEVLKEVRRLRPKLPVLVLSMYPEEQFAVRALRAGAAGYLTKKTVAAELLTAVRKVLGGGRHLSQFLAERLAVEIRVDSQRAPHETLSDREYQIFRLLAVGNTVKQISEELFLSPQTVSTHRSHILDKLGLTTNAELTQYAIYNHLLE